MIKNRHTDEKQQPGVECATEVSIEFNLQIMISDVPIEKCHTLELKTLLEIDTVISNATFETNLQPAKYLTVLSLLLAD